MTGQIAQEIKGKYHHHLQAYGILLLLLHMKKAVWSKKVSREQEYYSSLTAEAGYLYHGLEGSHRPYLSLHGLLLVNWNLSASLDPPAEAVAWGDPYRYASLSAGAFHLASLSGGASGLPAGPLRRAPGGRGLAGLPGPDRAPPALRHAGGQQRPVLLGAGLWPGLDSGAGVHILR